MRILGPVLAAFWFSSAIAQTGTEPTIRVTTTLVEVDAVVTDRRGKPVQGLTSEDFLLFEDGKPREITSFQYIRTGSQASPATAPGAPAPGGIVAELRPSDVRRSIAIVVDDLKMSIQSAHYTREALRKFVREQIAPGDMVAILATSGGMGILQQFTADKRQLLAAIGRVRVTLTGGGPAEPLNTIGAGELDDPMVRRIMARRFAVGTLGSIRHVADGMRRLPGRKSIILFSEGVRMSRDFSDEEPPVDVNEVRQVSDSANRSAVVVYTVDPRGVVFPGLQAADNVQGLESEEIRGELAGRTDKLRGKQETLRFLAAETGGTAHLNTNDLNQGLQQILEDQAGYYLLGFQPGQDDAERINKEGKFHRLRVSLKRKDLRVRYRRSYVADNGGPATDLSPAGKLNAALASPFANSALPLRLTPVYEYPQNGGVRLRAMLHIGGDAVQFGPADGNGERAASLRVVGIVEGETPGAGAPFEERYTIRLKEDVLERMRQGGFVYTVEQQLKKPGAFRIRAAVLDEVSGETGAASRYLEIPDLHRQQLAMSGILMAEGDFRQETTESSVSTASRIFQRGRKFSYGATVFHAPLDPATRQPAVDLQARLVHEGRVVWEGNPFPLVYRDGMDVRQIPGGGVLQLGERSHPGEYQLQITATPRTGKGTAVSESVEFELR